MKKICCLALFLFFSVSVSEAAKISQITGSPKFLKSSANLWMKAEKGMSLSGNDKVSCGPDSTAVIVTNEGHRIKLWPKSEIALSKVDSGNTAIGLLSGKLRSWVKKLKGRDKFEVKTPVAVCSVRGTDFLVEVVDAKQTKVEVFEGQVAARETQTGAEVLINAGEFTQIEPNQVPGAPLLMPDPGPEGDDGPQLTNQTKEEARYEVFNELSREEVLSRAADEIKLAEYQNGKALIDVSGNRVRMEEYIVRTQANAFKYVVLNSRTDRFDFGKIVFTFNDALPSDLTQATKNMYYATGSVKPKWWLTDVISIMSNTVDQVNEEASGGDMYADNPANPRRWDHGFASYKFYVNNKMWWEYADNNANGRLDSGEISYYNIASGLKINFSTDFLYDSDKGKYYLLDSNNDRVYFNEVTQPSGSTSFHFKQKNTYTNDQWITADDYIINDDGKILTLGDMSGKTPADLRQKAYESNFERIYSCSAFNGRKIDLVFSAKLLIDAGMLTFPDPSSLGQ